MNEARRNLTGPLTIGAIFLFGIAVFVGLRLATRASDPAPTRARFAAPDRMIRVISLDVGRMEVDRAIEKIKESGADLVLLQNVRTTDVARIGEAIGMSRARHPSGDVFYPAQNFAGPAAPFGHAIYSKCPLYEARSIPNRGGSFGVWAVAVFDDAKFMVASMRPTDASSEVLGTQHAMDVRERELSMLARAHRELGEPPIVIGANIRGFSQRDQNALTQLARFISQQGDAVQFICGWKVTVSPNHFVEDDSGRCIDLQRE